LVNFGILPLVFKSPADYDLFGQGDKVSFPDVRRLIENGSTDIPLLLNSREIITTLDVSERQRKELLAGGTLNFVKNLE